MATAPLDLSVETHVVSPSTRSTVVRAEHCEALAARHIAHVAVVDAAAPYAVVRTHLSGAFFQVCLAGEGKTLLDGAWYPHTPGMASFSPAHVLHAFHCAPRKRWRVAWVRFMPSSPRSVHGAMAPSMMAFDGEVLAHAILGLAAETAGADDPGNCAVWVDVIERYTTLLLEPLQRQPRLVALWNLVEADLARAWSLAEMARLANTSEEHLRRLCQQSLGRSPGRQLATMRMARAAHLLATTTLKIEAVAQAVGYVNPFAFSNTFKRLTGFRPSDYRSRPASAKVQSELH
ncbi:helix-turn-helix transcriptional regulator [Ramlibacter rhizophilus]|uniref:AraC family transcriptional regulator n=1 Tax=Ramlibacter rhizophilus TaxID=1781167 RepID=A0A4Z0BKK7_9BURK|nr:AraC family transcriptional regulator [Ramlibacter rhizophilus]TFY99852.1 AraC family transcriptional regulator [Ramlibacter rhizophilus]